MSRGPTAAQPDISRRLNQQLVMLPTSVQDAMNRRGRSREMSPAAHARKTNDSAFRARISVSVVPQSNLCKRTPQRTASTRPPRRSCSSARTHRADVLDSSIRGAPLASSSRLPPSPPPSPLPVPLAHPVPSRSESFSTLDSLSPDPTPLGPLTPPEHEDSYAGPAAGPPMPLDYYERPPSPPRTLEAQIQVAYAMDDFHRAKVLYLKYRGYEVTGDDDPRIDTVKDADFDSVFLPPGGLRLDEEGERRCRESLLRERERQRRIAREERLWALGRVHEESLRALRAKKARIAWRREEDARQRRRVEREAKERERERAARERELRHAPQLRYSGREQRPLLDYSTLGTERLANRPPPPRPAEEDPLLYSPIPYIAARSPSSSSLYSASPPASPDEHTLTLPRMQQELTRSLNRSVGWAEVIASMDGPLFRDDERVEARTRAKLSQSQRELFDSLLEPAGCKEQTSKKGKSRERARPTQTGVQRSEVGRGCVACSNTTASTSESADASATSSTASTVTRSNSWFSFGSRSSRLSVSTAITTPSSSIFSLKSPVVSASPSPFSSALHGEPRRVYYTCRHSHLAPVSPSDHPLSMDPSPRKPQPHATIAVPARGRTRTRTEQARAVDIAAMPDGGLVQRVGRSVSSLVDMAAQFQRAYVKATMFSVGTDPFARPRSASRSPSRSGWRRASAAGSPARAGGGGALKPEGYRAGAPDVALFLPAPDADIPEGAPPRAHAMVPLALCGPDAPAPAHPRVFRPPATPPRSPFRLQADPTGPRLRPVANPVLLRLQALHNVCAGLALRWEGRPREGRMCEGKERLVGVAWEGIGRSGLGWEVGVAC